MQGSAAMKCNEGNLRSAFQGVAFGRALATFVRHRAQLLFHGLAVCDSTSYRRTNGGSRWPAPVDMQYGHGSQLYVT